MSLKVVWWQNLIVNEIWKLTMACYKTRNGNGNGTKRNRNCLLFYIGNWSSVIRWVQFVAIDTYVIESWLASSSLTFQPPQGRCLKNHVTCNTIHNITYYLNLRNYDLTNYYNNYSFQQHTRVSMVSYTTPVSNNHYNVRS